MKIKFIELVKYLLAILFIYAGTYKISDIGLFASQMYQSPLLSSSLVSCFSFGIPLVEILIGLLLLISKKLEYALLWTSFSLMLLFSAYLIMLFTLYEKPPCACGGILSGMDYPVHIAFNIFFTLISGLALYLYETTESCLPLT